MVILGLWPLKVLIDASKVQSGTGIAQPAEPIAFTDPEAQVTIIDRILLADETKGYSASPEP